MLLQTPASPAFDSEASCGPSPSHLPGGGSGNTARQGRPFMLQAAPHMAQAPSWSPQLHRSPLLKLELNPVWPTASWRLWPGQAYRMKGQSHFGPKYWEANSLRTTHVTWGTVKSQGSSTLFAQASHVEEAVQTIHNKTDRLCQWLEESQHKKSLENTLISQDRLIGKVNI